MRVLIIGGYGFFGGRLAGLLAPDPRLHITVAGRSMAKAQAFCRTIAADQRIEAAQIDREAPDEALRRLVPDVVLDASGPFQAYGASPYRLAEACLATGAHYLDLADS